MYLQLKLQIFNPRELSHGLFWNNIFVVLEVSNKVIRNLSE